MDRPKENWHKEKAGEARRQLEKNAEVLRQEEVIDFSRMAFPRKGEVNIDIEVFLGLDSHSAEIKLRPLANIAYRHRTRQIPRIDESVPIVFSTNNRTPENAQRLLEGIDVREQFQTAVLAEQERVNTWILQDEAVCAPVSERTPQQRGIVRSLNENGIFMTDAEITEGVNKAIESVLSGANPIEKVQEDWPFVIMTSEERAALRWEDPQSTEALKVSLAERCIAEQLEDHRISLESNQARRLVLENLSHDFYKPKSVTLKPSFNDKGEISFEVELQQTLH